MGSFHFHLSLLTPLVFLSDLGLLLRGEVVGYVEGLSDLLGGLALDHACHGGTGEVQQRLNVHVVGGKDELEEDLLVNRHECGVPLLYNLGHVGGLQRLFVGRNGEEGRKWEKKLIFEVGTSVYQVL